MHTERIDDKYDDGRLAVKLNRQLDKTRILLSDFKKTIPTEQLAAAQAELQAFYEKKHINPDNNFRKLTDGLLVEAVICNADQNDLFGEEIVPEAWEGGLLAAPILTPDGEEDPNEKSNNDHFISTIPASHYDDCLNNVDVICNVRNVFTNHEESVFALDCTSNDQKVGEKMNYIRSDDKVPGFTAIEFYMDKSGVSKDSLGPGRLGKVPRFVVGFNAKLAREMEKFDPEDSSEWEKAEQRVRARNARYYLLQELVEQSARTDARLYNYFKTLFDAFKDTIGQRAIDEIPEDPVCEAVLNSVRGKSVLSTIDYVSTVQEAA